MNSQNPIPSQPLGSNGGLDPSPPVLTQTQEIPQPNSRPVEEILDTSKLTSVVWAHFLKVKTESGIKARCKYCKKSLGGQSNHGTTHLKTHMKNCLQRQIHDRSQKILGPDVITNSNGKRDVTAMTYNAEVSRKQLALAIVMHGYPLSLAEMLYVALPYKDVFYRLKQRDESQSYTSCPNESQWEFAAVICDKLKIFNDISELFSGSSYPTANLFFPKICELSGKLYEWRIDPDQRVSRMAELMWLKFSKYWMNIHELLAIAVILDPRCKLQMVEYWEMRLASTTNRICNEKMKDTLAELVGEYQRRNRLVNEHPASETNENFTSDDVDFDLFVSQKKRARTTPCQSELENYLDETLIPRSPDFDILMWWKMNGVKFPTLQAIARDLLAVPVTSVASESAFSAGGRLLDPHHSKLHSSTVESILCTKSWVHDELKIDSKISATVLDKIDEDEGMDNVGATDI